MSEPAQKFENIDNFKQNYTLTMSFPVKMAYFCCFSLEGILDFIQKSIIISTSGMPLLASEAIKM